MKRRQFITGMLAAASAVATTAIAPSAKACRCLEPTASSAYRSAHAVAVGKVTAVTIRPDIDGIEVALDVKEAWKGDLPATARVTTGTDCAFAFEKDGSYLLFLFRDSDKALSTERCMGSRKLAEAQSFLAWLRKNGRAGKVEPTGKPSR